MLWGRFSYYPWNYILAVVTVAISLKYILDFLNHKEFIDALHGSTKIYRIGYNEFPSDRLFIGKGFLWAPSHSAIVNKLMQNKELLQKGESLGGLSFIHGIGIQDEKDISIPIPDLVGHTIIVGTTRVGKTRAYEVIIAQLIKRTDEATIIFDPKGDAELLNRAYETCIKYGRKNDFMLFALPYPKFSAHYNPLRNFTIPNEIPDRIAMLLPSGGDSDAFKAFSWQVISTVTNAILYLGKRPTIKLLSDYSLAKTGELLQECITEAFRRKGRYEDIRPYVEDEDSKVEDFIGFYKKNPDVHHKSIDDLSVLSMHPKEHFQKMIASLTPVLNKLSTGEIGALLSDTPSAENIIGKIRQDSIDEQSENIFNEIDWERAIKNKKVIYMLFGSLSMRDTAKAVIRMALQDFTSFVGARYSYMMSQRNFVNLVIDEFSEIVDSSFINLLNKAGGANIRIFLASQSVADLESELRSAAKAQQIFDNLNNKIWLRTTDMSTAKVFSDAVGSVSVSQSNSGFSVSPNTDSEDGTVFRSSYSYSASSKNTPLIEPSWILKLPKGQGFMLSGGRVFKVRIPLLPECQVDYYKEKGIKTEIVLPEEQE